MRFPRALVLLLILTALAGCNDGKGGKDGGDGITVDDEEFDDLVVTQTTGVIRGVVVDEAVRPVAGVVVVIESIAKEATSADSGAFGFDGLEPGTYFLSASKPGYGTVQVSATVAAGVAEPGIVKVLMVADPTTRPHFEQFVYHGYISCSFKVANYVFRASDCDPTGHLGYAADDDAAPFFPVEQQPTYYQSEIIWDSTQPAGDELVTIQIACSEPGEGGCSEVDNDGDKNRLCNVRGPAPLVCRVSATEGGGGGGVGIVNATFGTERMGFSVGVYANCDPCYGSTGAPPPPPQASGVSIWGVGLVLEQQFDVFATVFYGYEPPADWLFTESNLVPAPPA